jgi:DNA-binding ferritin-like protein
MPITINQYGGQPQEQKLRNVADINTTCFRYKCQVHIYHWQTKSFSRHKGADELLESLDNFLDRFTEAYMGKYGRPDFAAGTNIPISNMNDAQASAFLDEMIYYFTEVVPKYLGAKDTDLFNIRDEILAGINKVKYLFTLA